jgi:hypothetical protein
MHIFMFTYIRFAPKKHCLQHCGIKTLNRIYIPKVGIYMNTSPRLIKGCISNRCIYDHMSTSHHQRVHQLDVYYNLQDTRSTDTTHG